MNLFTKITIDMNCKTSDSQTLKSNEKKWIWEKNIYSIIIVLFVEGGL